MESPSHIHQINERVERLLLRYEEERRTNALLTKQVEALTHERDSLKSRLSAARARIDALIDRIPESAPSDSNPSSASGSTPSNNETP